MGSFTATIILQHPTKADVTITNCEFEITKANPETLIFTKITKKFTRGGTIDNAKIMSHIQGNKTGYTLKSITELAPDNVARVTGTAPNLALTMTKLGAFSATITLQHNDKKDAIITGAQFELSTKTVENLTFTKRTKAFATGGSFSVADILAGVQGNKTGFTIKNITVSSNIVTVSPAKALDFKNVAGTFTATIILQHSTKADVTITNCDFEITKGTAPTLTWTKQEKAFASGGEITNANLLSGLTGADADKRGYTIKTVTINNDASTGATVDGAGTSAKITSYKKVGTLTLTLVFEHITKADVSIPNCAFEITKATAPTLTWTKQTKVFARGGEITNADILAGLTGADADKQGYAIKTVTIANDASTGATVDGAGTSAKIRSYTKAGTLTLTLVFEHNTKQDVSITNCQFEITKRNAENLTFTKISKAFVSGGKFSVADILGGVQGTKTGYTVKNITNLNPSNLATVTASKELNFSGRAGSFTATIILEHS